MHDELTRSDLEKMQEELDDRRINLRPKLLEAKTLNIKRPSRRKITTNGAFVIWKI